MMGLKITPLLGSNKTLNSPKSGPKPTCELCDRYDFSQPYGGLPHIRKCDHCSLVFQYPKPNAHELKSLYSKDYFVSQTSKCKGYDNYLRDESNILRTFERRVRILDRFQRPPGHLLDIGCAAGFFLTAARESGWNAQGIELSEFAAEEAKQKGHRVYCGTLENFDHPPGRFETVSMWDVIEHLPDPRLDILRINKLLKMGGSFVFTTPAIDSVPAWLFKDRWMGFKENEHLYFFSKQTLKALLDLCGFRVKMLKFEGKYISFDLFKRRIACYSPWLSATLRKLFRHDKKAFDFYMNPFDIYLVIAEKVRQVQGVDSPSKKKPKLKQDRKAELLGTVKN